VIFPYGIGLETEGRIVCLILFCARNKHIFKKEGGAIFIHIMQSNTQFKQNKVTTEKRK
jgi:hypothetical protein